MFLHSCYALDSRFEYDRKVPDATGLMLLSGSEEGHLMIPNRLTFVFLAPAEFSLVSHLAIKSAAVVNEPTEVPLLCDKRPTGL